MPIALLYFCVLQITGFHSVIGESIVEMKGLDHEPANVVRLENVILQDRTAVGRVQADQSSQHFYCTDLFPQGMQKVL